MTGDFNMSPYNSNLKNFVNRFPLNNLIRQPRGFKLVPPTCISVITSIQKSHFMKSFESRLSDLAITRQ